MEHGAAAWREWIETIREDAPCDDGINLFQCAFCGRLAGVYSGT